jgi:hypothetical protein
MPHAELKYSADLPIDAPAILQAIEAVIQKHDAGSGSCKGRSYPALHFHHSHMMVHVALLTKPHRDQAFSDALMAELESCVKSMIPVSCHFSLELSYSSTTYLTNMHTVD